MKKGQDLLMFLLEGNPLTTIVKTRRGNFTLKFPLPSDLRKVEVSIADMMGGKPASSFVNTTLFNFRLYATLDAVITDGPDWWKDLDSVEQCPDDDLLADIYRRYLQFYTKTQKNLREDGSSGDGEESTGDTEDETLADGAFSGVTHGRKVPKAK